ncbi:AAA family ATPase, partial [Staphylococcus hominis]
MINIESISISNFRSFKEKSFSKNLKQLTSMNIFTGKNNAGKTNILRAIHLFFNPLEYDELKDMHMIKKITGGSSKHPTIEIFFKDDSI